MAAARQKCFLFLLLNLMWIWNKGLIMAEEIIIQVGVVLDLNSNIGKMAESCISLAVSDFYAAKPDYQTRISLLTRDSRSDVVTAAAEALDLIKNEQVQAIIGPQKSSQAKFVAELGAKSQVPVLSFSATSPSVSPTQSQYFVRTTQDDSFQVEAIAAIVQAYGWSEIVPIYEDSEYGHGLIPYLLDAFQRIDIRVPYASTIRLSFNDSEIKKELQKSKDDNKKIFLVHMTAALASRLFMLANDLGMMSEGYAWLVTAGLSTLADPVDKKVMDAMQGVLGVRPHIPLSKELEMFKSRWRNSKNGEVNLFGLWAYDTVWAIAEAVEKTGILHTNYSIPNATKITVDLAALGVSNTGPELLKSVLSTRFQGLCGDFHLVNGEMTSSAFEIVNMIGKTERIIGYWTPRRGLSSNLDNNGETAYSTSKNNLKKALWPGDTTDQPKKLSIGVPLRSGFLEFIRVQWTPKTVKPIVTGFASDVFNSVVDALPFPLPNDFVPYVTENREAAGTYDDLLRQIELKKFDAVVADATIVADRSLYVDFTLPFSESGVSMLVLMKHDERENMWIFLKPLSWKLWLTTGFAFIVTGLVVWVLEYRINRDFRGPPRQQLGTIFWFSFSTLVFAHRERVVNNLTRFVLIIWIFVVLIISQSYTASLASMLTTQRLQPTFVDVKEIKKNGYSVGYQTNSFVKDFLINQLDFDEKLLKNYTTAEEYHDALINGTRKGGVAAIFDEIPYIKVFLAKTASSSKFKMVGPIYKTGGFGFAFPHGSPLVSHISRAILNVTEDKDKMEKIERYNFGEITSSSWKEDEDATSTSGGLSVSSFGGLFIITAVAYFSSLLMHIVPFLHSHWQAANTTTGQETSFRFKILELAKHFDQKDHSFSAHRFITGESRVHPVTNFPHQSSGTSSTIDDHVQNHTEISTEMAMTDNIATGNPGDAAVNAPNSA